MTFLPVETASIYHRHKNDVNYQQLHRAVQVSCREQIKVVRACNGIRRLQIPPQQPQQQSKHLNCPPEIMQAMQCLALFVLMNRYHLFSYERTTSTDISSLCPICLTTLDFLIDGHGKYSILSHFYHFIARILSHFDHFIARILSSAANEIL